MLPIGIDVVQPRRPFQDPVQDRSSRAIDWSDFVCFNHIYPNITIKGKLFPILAICTAANLLAPWHAPPAASCIDRWKWLFPHRDAFINISDCATTSADRPRCRSRSLGRAAGSPGNAYPKHGTAVYFPRWCPRSWCVPRGLAAVLHKAFRWSHCSAALFWLFASPRCPSFKVRYWCLVDHRAADTLEWIGSPFRISWNAGEDNAFVGILLILSF